MRLSREAWALGRGKLFVDSLVAQDRSTESSELRSTHLLVRSAFGHSRTRGPAHEVAAVGTTSSQDAFPSVANTYVSKFQFPVDQNTNTG